MLELKDYEQAGQTIGEKFVASGGACSINDLATKVANEVQLNPEGIRTVVRIANVVAFERSFAKKASDSSSDRMIEFELGDPEVVIRNLHKEAETTHAAGASGISPYDVTMDHYGDMPSKSASYEKTATPSKAPSPTKGLHISVAEASHKFKLAEARMESERKQAEVSWSGALEKAAQCLRVDVVTTEQRATFEKTALASLGEEYQAELVAVNAFISPTRGVHNMFGGEKVASVMANHVGIVRPEYGRTLKLVKEAHQARCEHTTLLEGIAWARKIAEEIK